MKSALIDSSSAILLYKAGLFGTMCKAYRLIMPVSVLQEVTVSARHGSAAFREASHSGAVHVIEAHVGEHLPSYLTRLGAGERDTVLAFDALQTDFVVIDDLGGVRLCRRRGIPHINALLCPKALFAAGRISAERCRLTFERLISIGRYSAPVIAYARHCAAERMQRFQPVG